MWNLVLSLAILVASMGAAAPQMIQQRLGDIEFQLQMQDLNAQAAERAAAERERRREVGEFMEWQRNTPLPPLRESPCRLRDQFGACAR